MSIMPGVMSMPVVGMRGVMTMMGGLGGRREQDGEEEDRGEGGARTILQTVCKRAVAPMASTEIAL